MCTTCRYIPDLQIAAEDIICYKYVEIRLEHRSLLDKLLRRKKVNYFLSKVYPFAYAPNTVYTTELDSFTKASPCYARYQSCRGFYAYKDPSKANVKCVIPKGAKYYLAFDYSYNEWIYTSNQIKIISIL